MITFRKFIVVSVFSLLVAPSAFSDDPNYSLGFGVNSSRVFEALGRLGFNAPLIRDLMTEIGAEARLSGPNQPAIGVYVKQPLNAKLYGIAQASTGRNYLTDAKEKSFNELSVGVGYKLADGMAIEGRIGREKRRNHDGSRESETIVGGTFVKSF